MVKTGLRPGYSSNNNIINSSSPNSKARTTDYKHAAMCQPLNKSGRSATRSRTTRFVVLALSLCLLLYSLTTYLSLSTPSHTPSDLQWRRLSAQKEDSTVAAYAVSAADQTPSAPPVRVYMYDLPRKFTFGVIEQYQKARGLKYESAQDLKYPGNQHGAEWWLFSDLSRNSRSPNSPIVRTFKVSEADLFYVPFFSSLSLVVNPRKPQGEGFYYSDEEMQEELVAWLERQDSWRRFAGRDHVIICQDPNALYKVVHRLKNAVLLISDFGRLKKDEASLMKDVILPYSHRINPFKGDIGIENRPSLLFFMGNRFRKEGGKVRDLLFQVLENEEDMVIKHGTQSRESRRYATQGMHTSKFCLHPAGDTPSACRLFDAIVSMCVPVVVSDEIELPFEDVIDYSKVAIFVSSADAVRPGYLASILREKSEQLLLQYHRELKKIKKYFEYEEEDGTVNEIWRQVALKLPSIRLMINRDRRLVTKIEEFWDIPCICSDNSSSISLHNTHKTVENSVQTFEAKNSVF